MILNDLICSITQTCSGAQTRFLAPISGEGPKIYFANHQSHLDTFVIYSSLPKSMRLKLRPVARMDYWNKGCVRRYLSHRVVNTLLIDSHQEYPVDHALHPVNQMIEAIDQGYSLLIFPEGTRHTQATVGAFKSGIYHLARQRPNVELIPVYVENLHRILPKGEYIPVPMVGRVTFRKALWITPGEGKEEFLERARRMLEEIPQS